jgi:hypothetical protein
MAMSQLIAERLETIRAHLTKPPRDIAFGMTEDGRFQRFKCAFGTEVSSAMPTLRLNIPGLAPGLDFPSAGVSNSQIVINRQGAICEYVGWYSLTGTRGEIKRVFDAKIGQMYELIDGQLERMRASHPHEQIVESPPTGSEC